MLRLITAIAIACVVSFLICGYIVPLMISDKEAQETVSLFLGTILGGVGAVAGLIWDARSEGRF